MDPKHAALLRQLPQVDDLLRHPELAPAVAWLPRSLAPPWYAGSWQTGASSSAPLLLGRCPRHWMRPAWSGCWGRPW